MCCNLQIAKSFRLKSAWLVLNVLQFANSKKFSTDASLLGLKYAVNLQIAKSFRLIPEPQKTSMPGLFLMSMLNPSSNNHVFSTLRVE